MVAIAAVVVTAMTPAGGLLRSLNDVKSNEIPAKYRFILANKL